jgi:hypothetical protein
MTNRHLILPTLDDQTRMSWFVFVVRLNDLFEPEDRDAIIGQLRAEGIGASNYFPPIHLQPYVRERLRTKAGDYPICEYVAARTIALPFLQPDDQASGRARVRGAGEDPRENTAWAVSRDSDQARDGVAGAVAGKVVGAEVAAGA